MGDGNKDQGSFLSLLQEAKGEMKTGTEQVGWRLTGGGGGGGVCAEEDLERYRGKVNIKVSNLMGKLTKETGKFNFKSVALRTFIHFILRHLYKMAL